MIKTIADFKRAMIPGTIWETTHQYWEPTHQYSGDGRTPEKSLGVRECVLNNSVGFGFRSASGGVSHAAWPKRAEFSLENEGKTVVITKGGFVRLKYTQVRG